MDGDTPVRGGFTAEWGALVLRVHPFVIQQVLRGRPGVPVPGCSGNLLLAIYGIRAYSVAATVVVWLFGSSLLVLLKSHFDACSPKTHY